MTAALVFQLLSENKQINQTISEVFIFKIQAYKSF